MMTVPLTDAHAMEAGATSMDTKIKVTCKRREGSEAGVRRSGIPRWDPGKGFVICYLALVYVWL